LPKIDNKYLYHSSLKAIDKRLILHGRRIPPRGLEGHGRADPALLLPIDELLDVVRGHWLLLMSGVLYNHDLRVTTIIEIDAWAENS
jgi:hypothetical protein